jgi:hypothetical protein
MSIFFPGDQVRTKDGATGVIEDFTYDLPAILRGFSVDIANIRTGGGELIAVSCADIEVMTVGCEVAISLITAEGWQVAP